MHCLRALVVIGSFLTMVRHFFLYKIGNRFYLSMAVRLADDKKVCYRLGYLSQVQADNLLPFLLLDGLYDGFEDLTAPG